MGMMQPWFNAEMAESSRLSGSSSFWWGVEAWNSKRNGGNGFLKQTCTTHLLSAVHQLLRTSATERLAAPLPTTAERLADTSNSLLLKAQLWQFFSAAATKGWAWCNHDLMQRWRKVRGSQEAQASGRECRLGIPRGMAGMDFWNKHVQHISFRLCITFCEHRHWQPHFQPTVAKSSISTSVHWFAAVTQNDWEHNHCIVTNLGDHNSVTKPPASLHKTSVSSAAATKGWAWCKHDLMQRWRKVRSSQEAQASGGEWRLRFYKRHGFLEQTCPTHLLSAVHHILRTSATERLAGPLPTHGGFKLSLQ